MVKASHRTEMAMALSRSPERWMKNDQLYGLQCFRRVSLNNAWHFLWHFLVAFFFFFKLQKRLKMVLKKMPPPSY
jgi:hypothetical protein